MAAAKHLIAVERKGVTALVGCCDKNRHPFDHELNRGRGLDYILLMVEASVEGLLQQRYSFVMPHRLPFNHW